MNKRRQGSGIATEVAKPSREALEISQKSESRLPLNLSKKGGTGHGDGAGEDTVQSGGGSTQKDSSQFLATSAIYNDENEERYLFFSLKGFRANITMM